MCGSRFHEDVVGWCGYVILLLVRETVLCPTLYSYVMSTKQTIIILYCLPKSSQLCFSNSVLCLKLLESVIFIFSQKNLVIAQILLFVPSD